MTISAGDGDHRHGTVNGYSNLKCRCTDCRRVWADYMWDKRRQRAAAPIPEAIHGKYTTYFNYMCRCTKCRAAHNTYETAKRARKKVSA